MNLTAYISLIQFSRSKSLENSDFDDIRLNFTGNKLENLRTHNLSIGVIDRNKVIICWKELMKLNTNEDSDNEVEEIENELTEYENNINTYFPNAEILTILISEPSKFYYLSYISESQLRRRKCLQSGEILFDEGSLLKYERIIADKIEQMYKNAGSNICDKIRDVNKGINEDDTYKVLLKHYSTDPNNFNLNYFNGELDKLVYSNLLQLFMKMEIDEILSNIHFSVFNSSKFSLNDDFIGRYILTATNNITALARKKGKIVNYLFDKVAEKITDFNDRINLPCNENLILRFEDNLGVILPIIYKEILMQFNGDKEFIGWCGGYHFLEIEIVQSIWQSDFQDEKRKIPFASDYGGQFLCINLNLENKETYGTIIYFSFRKDKEENQRILFKSFNNFLEFIITSIDNEQLAFYREDEDVSYLESQWDDEWSNIISPIGLGI